MEICPLPLPRQEHLHLLLRAWWTKLRASPTRKLTCRQGAGKGVHKADQKQTGRGGGSGRETRCSQLRQQVLTPGTRSWWGRVLRRPGMTPQPPPRMMQGAHGELQLSGCERRKR